MMPGRQKQAAAQQACRRGALASMPDADRCMRADACRQSTRPASHRSFAVLQFSSLPWKGMLETQQPQLSKSKREWLCKAAPARAAGRWRCRCPTTAIRTSAAAAMIDCRVWKYMAR